MTSSYTADLRAMAADIKLAHSIFALPFALLASVMAVAPNGVLPDGRWLAGRLTLIILAMFFARTAAMLTNRIADADLDARNPRTAGRALASGRVSRRAVWPMLVGAGLAFFGVCIAFGLLDGNWWPTGLGVPVLGWVCLYPYLKRFTIWCHVYLGVSLALSPLAAALALAPDALATQPALWWLAGMVAGWVAGFDIIYALQDRPVDKTLGLHSIPVRFGDRGAVWLSRLLHLLSCAALVTAWRVDPRFGLLFGVGVVTVLALLVVEQATVMRWGTTRIALTFFTLNGVISCVIGALGIADVIV